MNVSNGTHEADAKQLRDTLSGEPDEWPDYAGYAWIIDTDHLAEPDGEPGDWCANAATVAGPRDAPQELLDRLIAGEGRAWRIYDDDGEHYYSGRIVFTEPLAPLDDVAFGPLTDFGAPNAGATEIRYQTGPNGQWETL